MAIHKILCQQQLLTKLWINWKRVTKIRPCISIMHLYYLYKLRCNPAVVNHLCFSVYIINFLTTRTKTDFVSTVVLAHHVPRPSEPLLRQFRSQKIFMQGMTIAVHHLGRLRPSTKNANNVPLLERAPPRVQLHGS